MYRAFQLQHILKGHERPAILNKTRTGCSHAKHCDLYRWTLFTCSLLLLCLFQPQHRLREHKIPAVPNKTTTGCSWTTHTKPSIIPHSEVLSRLISSNNSPSVPSLYAQPFSWMPASACGNRKENWKDLERAVYNLHQGQFKKHPSIGYSSIRVHKRSFKDYLFIMYGHKASLLQFNS